MGPTNFHLFYFTLYLCELLLLLFAATDPVKVSTVHEKLEANREKFLPLSLFGTWRHLHREAAGALHKSHIV